MREEHTLGCMSRFHAFCTIPSALSLHSIAGTSETEMNGEGYRRLNIKAGPLQLVLDSSEL